MADNSINKHYVIVFSFQVTLALSDSYDTIYVHIVLLEKKLKNSAAAQPSVTVKQIANLYSLPQVLP